MAGITSQRLKRQRSRLTYLDLWQDAQRQYDAVLLGVKIVSKPWGESLRVEWGPRYYAGDPAVECGAPLKRLLGTCQRIAGMRTGHTGVGRCSFHGGNTPAGVTEGMMIMACTYANHFKISPPEALQGELERTEGAVRWLDAKLATAESDADILPPTKDHPGGALGQYTALRERERAHLVRVATAALTGGVTQLIGERIRAQGEGVATLLSATLDALGLDEETENRAREILAEQLHALADAGERGAIDSHYLNP